MRWALIINHIGVIKMDQQLSLKTILSLAGVLVIGILIFMSAEQIEEGTRGIKKVFGKVDDDAMTPGFYFINPISTKVIKISVKEEKLQIDTTAYTKDTQTVNVKFAITYYPQADSVHKLYSNFGLDWQVKILEPAVLGSLKDSVGKYIADELVGKREMVKAYAEEEIKKALAMRKIIVTRLDILNLDFNDAYESAVEAKVVAVQEAERSKNRTVQIKEEAEQQIIAAKAEAESMRIRSQALSQNKSLVEYEAVQKWDGKLPQYNMGSSMPFIKLGN
jgi:regulator of protease activity HflC (stomatin/prohibitin superfamily)